MVLGLTVAGRQLLYAVNATGKDEVLRHIGRIALTVDATQALRHPDSDSMRVILAAVEKLVDQHSATRIRIILPAELECWATVPKLVYDHPSERDAYLAVLHHGSNRSDLVPIWHDLNNRDYKLFCIRNKPTLAGYKKIGELVPEYDICSEFEAGQQWTSRQASQGGLLMVGCYDRYLAVTSYALGKLRAATWIAFEDPADLNYTWPNTAISAKWMSGIYDRVALYGPLAWQFADILKPFWDAQAEVIRLDTLRGIGVSAPEETYGFGLDEAFPAIMMAID